jgi:hypothetical protein
MEKGMRYRVLERALLGQSCTWRAAKGDHVVWYCPCGAHMAVAVKARVVSPGVVRDIMNKLACLPEGWLS